MAERVRLHKASRGPKWKVIEEPLDIAEAIETRCSSTEAVLVDCLTLWLSNVLLKEGEKEVPSRMDRLLAVIARRKQCLVMVANEVGTGVVPAYASGRTFRDYAGFLNQRIASAADEVFFMIAGLPLRLKGGGKSPKMP